MGTSAGVSVSGTGRSPQVEKRCFRDGMRASARATVFVRQSAAALRIASSSPGDSPSAV